MKKIIASGIFMLAIVATICFFVFNNNSKQLNSSFAENVSFNISNEKLFSGKNYNNEFEKYNLKILTVGENFVNPQVVVSSNVIILNIDYGEKEIDVSFYINSGTQIVFSLTSQNGYDVSKVYQVQENQKDITYKFYNVYTNEEVILKEDNEKYVLYFVDDLTKREDAFNNGYVSQFYIKFYYNNKEIYLDNLTYQKDENLNIEKNLITACGIGNANLNILLNNLNDDIVNLEFKIKGIEPETVEVLNSNVVLDLVDKNGINLDYKIYPKYANNPVFEYAEFIKIENMKILPLKVGSGEIKWNDEILIRYVVLDSILFEEEINNNSVYKFKVDTSLTKDICEITTVDYVSFVNLNKNINDITFNVFLYENNEIARLKIKAFVISDTNQMVIGEPTFLTFNKLNLTLKNLDNLTNKNDETLSKIIIGLSFDNGQIDNEIQHIIIINNNI